MIPEPEKIIKKYMINMNDENKFVNFGQLCYKDFTKYSDEQRTLNYLKRATKIKGS
jgi:hypothetical protein